MSATERLKFVLTADASGAIKAFEKVGTTAEKELKKADSGIAKASAQLTKFGTGAVVSAGVVGGALVGLSGKFSSLGVEVGKFSTATGISAEKSSRWIEVAGDMGIEADGVESAINKMNRTAGTTPDKFADMGAAIARTSDGAVDANQTFLNVIDRLKGITDPAERARVGTALLGKSWTGMSELIAEGSSSLTASLAAVNDAKVFDDEKVQKAKDYRAAMDTLKDSLEELGLSIGAGAAPVIATLATAVGNAVSAFGSLDSITGGAAGNFLAIATAGLGAAGAMSVIAGQALKAKDSLMPMVDGSRALTGVGKAALGAGILVAGFTVITAVLGAESKKAQADVDDLAGRAKALGLTFEEAAKQKITEYLNKNKNLADAMKIAGLTADDLRNAVVKGGDALVAFKGKVSDAAASQSDNARQQVLLRGEIENTVNGIQDQSDAYVTLNAETKATDAATKAIGETEKERADRIQGVTDALKAQKDAQKSAREEALRSIDADFNYRASVQDTKDALEEYTKTTKDHSLSAEEQQIATDKMVTSMADQATAYAASKGLAEGSKEQINAMIESLYIQAAAAAPGSALQAGLGEYITKLEAINRGLTPEALKLFNMNNGVNMHMGPPVAGPSFERKAAGGITKPGLTLVGEQGPELVVFNGGENVLTASQTREAYTQHFSTPSASSSSESTVAPATVATAAKAVQDERSIWAAQFELGEISAAKYKELLEGRLGTLDKYSADYMSTWREIRGLDRDAETAANKATQDANKAKEDDIEASLARIRKLYLDAANKRKLDDANDAADSAVASYGSAMDNAFNVGKDKKATKQDRQAAIDDATRAGERAANALYDRADASANNAGFDDGTVEWARSVRAQLLGDEANAPTLSPWIDRILEGIPQLATGGIVKARSGGTLALLGEGGRDEAVIPLGAGKSMVGGGINLTVNAGLGTDGAAVGAQIVNVLKQYQRTNGPFAFTG
jgi:hypothetical protein